MLLCEQNRIDFFFNFLCVKNIYTRGILSACVCVFVCGSVGETESADIDFQSFNEFSQFEHKTYSTANAHPQIAPAFHNVVVVIGCGGGGNDRQVFEHFPHKEYNINHKTTM